jgi:TorA maturation chaperone TorD
MDSTELIVLLKARGFSYQALHVVFGQKPKAEIIAAVLGADSLQTFSGLDLGSDADYGKELNALGELRATYAEGGSDTAEQRLQDLNIEYSRLFVVPGKDQAVAWEYAQRSRERKLFSNQVLDLREEYRSEGCLPAEYPHVSDDHLAIELDFMRFLSEACTAAVEAGDETEVVRLLNVQGKFLDEHLLGWVPTFLNGFRTLAKTEFYLRFGDLLGLFLKNDRALITATLEELEKA